MTIVESQSILSKLTGLKLFEGVAPDLLRLITSEMQSSFQDGDVIQKQGDNSTDLILLTRGQACVLAEDTFIVCRSAPAAIGEQAFIDETTRSATIEAQGYVEAFIVPAKVVERLMNDQAFVRNLLRIVSAKLREATEERAVRYRNEKRLFGEFRAHLSKQVTDRLLATGIDYGRPRYIENAVILMSDIRSFTDLSAGISPEQIAEELSLYLSAVVDIIHQHGGVVDKFIGDAVLAFWGFTDDEETVNKALSCAEEMVRAAAGMSFGGEPIRIGVGLNYGSVFVGNVGSDRKRQFTILGMPVNLAARFESKAKELQAPIVLGQSFYDRLAADKQTLLVTHSNQPIKGDNPQTLYTLDPVVFAEKGIK